MIMAQICLGVLIPARYISSVMPVILGSGVRLFAPHASGDDALRFVKA